MQQTPCSFSKPHGVRYSAAWLSFPDMSRRCCVTRLEVRRVAESISQTLPALQASNWHIWQQHTCRVNSTLCSSMLMADRRRRTLRWHRRAAARRRLAAMSAARKRRSFNAAGQFLGFALQEFRVAVHLFVTPHDEDVVSLEFLGDTAVHLADGRVKTEEHKSRTKSRANPIADTSPELWKTLRNWVDAVECGDLPIEHAAFFLHVSQAFDGDIVRAFAEARSVDDAIEALRFASERVWPDGSGTSLVARLPKATQEHVERFFSAQLRPASR